jgi:hypothetical protein
MAIDLPHIVRYTVGLMMKKRRYISVYFEDSLVRERKKRDVTLAFAENDELYLRCKDLGSSEIKRIVGTASYSELVERAQDEHRSLSNYIKHKLRGHFS